MRFLSIIIVALVGQRGPPVESHDGPLTAEPDFFVVRAGEDLVLDAVDLLANDLDPSGDALDVIAVSAPGQGRAALVDDTVVFRPPPGFRGELLLHYTAADGDGTAIGVVTVLVL